MNELVKYENNEIIISEEFRSKLINFEQLKKEIEYQEKVLKAELVELMPQIGKERIILDGICIQYKKGYTKKTFDGKRFQNDHPETYDEYLKESNVDPSIMIKIGD